MKASVSGFSVCPSRSTLHHLPPHSLPPEPKRHKDAPLLPTCRWVWPMRGTGGWEESEAGYLISTCYSGDVVCLLCSSPKNHRPWQATFFTQLPFQGPGTTPSLAPLGLGVGGLSAVAGPGSCSTPCWFPQTLSIPT